MINIYTNHRTAQYFDEAAEDEAKVQNINRLSPTPNVQQLRIMFSNSIDSKINKIKLNFDSYLNQKKKDNQSQPPVPSIRRPEQLPSNYPPGSQANPTASTVPNPATTASTQSKPFEIDIKQLILQGKTFQRQSITLKNLQKEKTINISYTEDQNRYRIEIKAIDNNLELKINQQKSTIEISFKRAARYKYIRPESGEPKWMIINTNELKDDKILLICNKEGKAIKSCFQGIVPQQLIKIQASEVKVQEKEKIQGMQREDGQDIDDVISFAMPSQQQFADTEKFRRALKDMKEEEKNMIIMDIFKIKKEYDDPTQIDRRRLKCPIQACQKIYREISQLKTHLKKHPELNKHGIELTDYGTFEYNYKAMDLALFLGKLFPFEMKKIIKKMKTKTIAE